MNFRVPPCAPIVNEFVTGSVKLNVPVWTRTVPLFTKGEAIVVIPVPAVFASVPAFTKKSAPMLFWVTVPSA